MEVDITEFRVYWEKLTRKSHVHFGSINICINRNASQVIIGNRQSKETCPNYLVLPLGSILTSLTLTNSFTTKHLRSCSRHLLRGRANQGKENMKMLKSL